MDDDGHLSIVWMLLFKTLTNSNVEKKQEKWNFYAFIQLYFHPFYYSVALLFVENRRTMEKIIKNLKLKGY